MADREDETDEQLPVQQFISTITLITLTTRHEVFGSPNDEGIHLSYTCFFQRPLVLNEAEQKWMTIVVPTAGKQSEKDPGKATEISAAYGVAYTSSGDPDIDRERYVAAVWNRFSVIFDMLSAQMNSGLPPLPPQPGMVEETVDDSDDTE